VGGSVKATSESAVSVQLIVAAVNGVKTITGTTYFTFPQRDG